MKNHKKIMWGAVAIVAVILAACGGSDSKSQPTQPTAAPTTVAPATTPPPPTTVPAATTPPPPTTVTEVTITVPVIDYSYELVLSCDAVECFGELPEDFPVEAQNPYNPSITLGEYIALGPGATVCVHTTTGSLPGTTGEGAKIKSIDGGQPVPSIHAIDASGIEYWLDAVFYGVSPEPNGEVWNEEQYVTVGTC